MNTIEQIEKRRRELRVISLFLICMQSLIILGLLFFIDKIVGFVGAVQSNGLVRGLFICLTIAFIYYLVQKERAQSRATKKLLEEMSCSAVHLRKELKYNRFLREISFLVENLRDEAVMKRLFDSTLRFLRAEGGAVVLKNQGKSWKAPLVCHPQPADSDLIDEIIKFVGKTGRSFIQPMPDYPDHRTIKKYRSIIAAPIRLDNRLYGIIAFWSNDNVFDPTDLQVIELIAKQTADCDSDVVQIQERADQFYGLLNLIAETGDAKAKTKNRTKRLVEQVHLIGDELNLSDDMIESIEVAAKLRHIDLLANGAGAGDPVSKIASSLNFPKSVVDALVSQGGPEKKNGKKKQSANGSKPIGSQVLSLAELYVNKAFPPRGRKPKPEKVLKQIEPVALERFDDKVFKALCDAIAMKN